MKVTLLTDKHGAQAVYVDDRLILKVGAPRAVLPDTLLAKLAVHGLFAYETVRRHDLDGAPDVLDRADRAKPALDDFAVLTAFCISAQVIMHNHDLGKSSSAAQWKSLSDDAQAASDMLQRVTR